MIFTARRITPGIRRAHRVARRAGRPLRREVPYKAYMGPSVGDLFFRSPEELDRTLAHYRGRAVSFHCEDPGR